ncbi:4Fe-4S dicluster domain-containing protein [Pseudobutyrivibrio sp. ACV-2]|uniref:4Fe-4S binding protein n=1 Tax=Pseudobutyrivibrio sp. ACV-2 TaxID=1520801 RepID=UPI0008987976|nr:4Fe-4S binding protein [Pseudobutyrivibrio sp. ACV-2]SEA93092.1 4Fe-4S dicluster domain-containing protein [Pseudobutyrivibrio sp. ACV-2]
MAKKKANVNVAGCVACGVCRLQCPKNAISIYRGCYATVDENLCVGCGLCAKACPANVIEVKEREVING